MASLQAEKQQRIEPEKFAGNREFVQHLIHARACHQAALYTADRDILDLGCGSGDGTRLLRTSGARVIGVDASAAAIALARSRHGRSGIDFRCLDGPALPFVAASFDIVTCFRMLDQVVDLPPLLAEIGRVLRPGGMAFFATPNGRLRLYPGGAAAPPPHSREFGEGELRALLRRFFATTEVLGLFAVKPVYEVEAERVRGSRQRARLRQGRDGAAVVGRLKLLLLQLRSGLQARIHDLDRQFQRRYTARDLYYKRENFDAALALLAVCTVDREGRQG